MKKANIFLLVIVISIPVFSLLRFFSLPYIHVTGFTQGTTYSVKVLNKFTVDEMFLNEQKSLSQLIEASLDTFDASLNSYIPNSIISRVNRNEDVLLDDLFVDCFKASEKVFKETDGTFDITGGPLYNAWGFGPGEKKNLNQESIDSILQFVGMEKVQIIQNKLIKADKNINLNVNAIAQGFSVDFIADILKKKGYNSYIVEIGGELKAKGLKRKKLPWRIGVDKPTEGNLTPGADLQLTLDLRDKSLATSGNYRKFIEEDGKKYSHSINPKTGYPVMHTLLSATVIADDCMFADAYATAFMVNGLQWSDKFVKNHPDLEVYFVYSDSLGNFKEYYTKGIEEMKYTPEK